jgi:hypothetical protein
VVIFAAGHKNSTKDGVRKNNPWVFNKKIHECVMGVIKRRVDSHRMAKRL